MTWSYQTGIHLVKGEFKRLTASIDVSSRSTHGENSLIQSQTMVCTLAIAMTKIHFFFLTQNPLDSFAANFCNALSNWFLTSVILDSLVSSWDDKNGSVDNIFFYFGVYSYNVFLRKLASVLQI